MNRVKVLQELKRYYTAELAEDKQDGSGFDCAVLDALDNLIAAQHGVQRTVEACRPELHEVMASENSWTYCPECSQRLHSR